MTAPRWSSSSTATPTASAAPVRTQHDGHRRCGRRRRRLRGATPTRAPGGRRRRGRLGGVQRRRRAGGRRRRCPPGITSLDRRSTTATPTSSPRAGCWSSAPSASGMQIADELAALGPAGHARRRRARAGAAHLPRPRTSSGGWRPPACSTSATTRCDDLVRARTLPSMQLVGSPRAATRSTSTRSPRAGSRLVGRLAAVRDGAAQLFSGSLPNVCALADLKLGRLLDTLRRLGRATTGVERRRAARALRADRGPRAAAVELDLARGEIRTILWATGYTPDLSWLELPVLDRKGRLSHDGGVDPLPRALRDRHAVPAPPQVHPDRRRGGRTRATSRPTWRATSRRPGSEGLAATT